MKFFFHQNDSRIELYTFTKFHQKRTITVEVRFYPGIATYGPYDMVL